MMSNKNKSRMRHYGSLLLCSTILLNQEVDKEMYREIYLTDRKTGDLI